jgi:hypothetical protein
VSLASESLRSTVIQRAGERCEYCLLTSRFQVGGFELDHIHPVTRGGPTNLDNLAFACPVCNGRKLHHIDGPDATTGEVVPLFNPRTQSWHDHFQLNYLALKQHGATAEARRPRMVIGPWQHIINQNRKLGTHDYGPDAVINWDGYICRWFDHYLKGIDNGVTNDRPVDVFVMGRNRWFAEQKVFHTAKHPSHVILPVIPAR